MSLDALLKQYHAIHEKVICKHPSWPKRVVTSIGHRLCLKFSARKLTFGVIPIGTKSSRLFPLDIIQFINDNFKQKSIDKVIDTYFKTMTIEYMSENFNKWNDIKNDQILLQHLRNFLINKQLLIATAINEQKLIHSRDLQRIRKQKQLQIIQHQSSVNNASDNNNKNIRKRVNSNTMNSDRPMKRRKMNVCAKINTHIEKLELEFIIKVQRNGALKIDGINSMNEWYSMMNVLETNNNNLNRMYDRIKKSIKNSELLPIIEQIKLRYKDSMNKLRLKFSIFENEWEHWNKEQLIYWIKNIENCIFNDRKYLKFIDEIAQNELIKCGNDILKLNDLSLFLLGVQNENDRNVIKNNIHRLKTNLNRQIVSIKKE